MPDQSLKSTINRSSLDGWLEENVTSVINDFCHTIIKQKGKIGSDALKDLVRFYEEAHRDARNYFHDMASITLHPLNGSNASNVEYPKSLPSNIHKEYFGETFAGLVSLYYRVIHDEEWLIPVFLHRNHFQVTDRLKRLKRNELDQKRRMIGRHGDDFLAISLNEDKTIKKVLVAEVKYRDSLSKTTFNNLLKKDVTSSSGNVKEECVLKHLSRQHSIPIDLSTLGKILKEVDAEKYQSTILDIDKIESELKSLDRIDVAIILYSKTNRNSTPPLLDGTSKPSQYANKRCLQITEVFVDGAEEIMNHLFDNMYLED